jgi:DNA/RNA endonuclease YhcR with UshA esterase domain
VTTATAAAAGAGALDAELIHVESAVVQDTSRTGAGEFVLTVDDGSGPVDVVLDAQITFSPQFGGAILGSTLDVTGLLVPATTGTRWLLKPRQNDDLVVQ